MTGNLALGSTTDTASKELGGAWQKMAFSVPWPLCARMNTYTLFHKCACACECKLAHTQLLGDICPSVSLAFSVSNDL